MSKGIGNRLLDAIGPHQDWIADAACTPLVASGALTLDDFYPGPGVNVRTSRAAAACAECPVRAACQEYAYVASEGHGIWGGLSERERRRIRRKRSAERRRSVA